MNNVFFEGLKKMMGVVEFSSDIPGMFYTCFICTKKALAIVMQGLGLILFYNIVRYIFKLYYNTVTVTLLWLLINIGYNIKHASGVNIIKIVINNVKKWMLIQDIKVTLYSKLIVSC